ncbi:MAG: glycosyl hydrolase, partial [Rhizorhabdus sp.]|nr:glycosyl hydrolase [Rhizorhabdus sp.]
MRPLAAFAVSAVFVAGCATARSDVPPATGMWLTTADGTQQLAPKRLQRATGPASGTEAITIDTSRRFQKVHGFGAAMTDASAEVISRLPPKKRHAAMAELFGRANGGLGLSFTRITLGASDFSTLHYSYDDTPGNVPDPQLRAFSIAPATKYVLPRIREALSINSDLLVMFIPWSAP